MPLFAALCLQLNLDMFYARTIIFVKLSFLRFVESDEKAIYDENQNG